MTGPGPGVGGVGGTRAGTVSGAGAGTVSGAGRAAGGPRFPGMTVQGWFAVVFAGFAVLVIAAAVVIGQLLAQGRAVSADLDGGVLPAQAQAYRLQGALVDQETGVRGYGITGQSDFLQPYTAGLATQADAATRLRRLIGADPLLAADLRGLEAAASQWRRSYAAPLIALARHGPLDGRDLGLLDASKHSFDHLRTLFAAQNAHLAAAASRDSDRLGTNRSISDWAFGTVLAVFLIASAVLALVLRNAVGAPLNRLRAASRNVLGGDFGHRIEPSGPADLRAVAADVEAMRSELVNALDSARAAEQVAASQAADLDAKAAELLRSNAELEQFAYVASHDLQEPLRKVASFCQLLEKRYGDKLDDRGRQYIGFAVDGAKRLQVLINDLLTFSRVGRPSEIRVRVALDEALDGAIAALGAAIEETDAVIERPARLPEVLGDRTLLVMLWQNLLGNAIKFRTPGCPPVVRITAERDLAGRWLCCVADQGIGIAPEFAEKVFVIFQRLHSRDSYPGTGIGLALCKRIAEYHGGDISIDTGYAEGTRVCFTLPGADEAAPDQAAGQATADQAAGDQTAPDQAAGQVSASPEGILT
ncbi:MAG: CHASE3 domain-containing protein [Streptosporangiaceae bacterium]